MKETDIEAFIKDPERFLGKILDDADSGGASRVSRARIMSEIYLAKVLKNTGSDIEQEMRDAANVLRESLEDHAKALNESAVAANQHAKSLKYATWALVVATIGLIIAAILQ